MAHEATLGYPQRFAQEALGHNSKAVHAAYAKKAEVRIPSLEQWERQMNEKIVQLEFPVGKPEKPSIIIRTPQPYPNWARLENAHDA